MYLNNQTMKKISQQSKSFYWMLSVLMVFGMASCRKYNDRGTGGTGAPKITRVRYVSKTDTIKNVSHPVNLDSSNVYDDIKLVKFDSTVTQGRLNTQYAIIGENLLNTTHVYFNGTEVYFNPALVSDKTIIVTIGSNVPFGPSQSNKLTVVTTQGKVDYDFSIAQPPPVITSFAPLAAGAGDIVTITGSVFSDIVSVKFDDTPAEIVGTPTTTEIKVKVPAGIVQAYVYVTTAGGTTKSAASFGFKYLIYGDDLTLYWGGNGGGYDGYGSTRDYASTAHVKRGTHAIAVNVDNGYGALQLGYGGATLNVASSGLTSIKVSIYGGTNFKTGDRVQLVVNGGYDKAVPLTIVPGAYTDFTIPLSSLGNPTTISEITFQTLGVGAPATFYVDDLGFI
jgi:hypothetical protein